MDASILNYTVNDNVGEFLSKDKKLILMVNGLILIPENPLMWKIQQLEKLPLVQLVMKKILTQQSRQQENF